MNLKGYIKLLIMALAIMFLCIENVASTQSILSQTNNNTAAITAFLQATGFTSGQTFTLDSPDGTNIDSIDYIRLKMARVAGDETGILYFNVSILNDDDSQGQLLSTDTFDISTLSTTVTWTSVKTTSLDLDNTSGTRYLFSYSCSCDHVVAVRFGGYTPSATDNGRIWSSMGGIDNKDLAYEIGYTFSNTDSTYINFDKTYYNLNESGTINYGLDTYFWNVIIYKYYRVFINDEYPETKEQYFIWANQGEDQVQFTKYGQYGTFIKQTGLLGIPADDDTIIAQAFAIVEDQPSKVFINSTVDAGTVVNFSYYWGVTPTQNGYKWAYIKRMNPVNGLWETENTIALLGTTKNILYNSSALVKKTGDYLIQICDLNRKCPMASQTFKSINMPNSPKSGYTINLINITSLNTVYNQGDLLQFYFQVASANFTNDTITIEIYNNVSRENYTLLTAQQDFERHDYYLGQLYGSGNSLLCVVGTSSLNIRKHLACEQIVLSLIDSEGYGLSISDLNPCVGQEIIVTGISPENSTITFSDRDIKIYNFSGTRTWRIIPDGDMTISIDNNYGIQKKNAMINVNDYCEQINEDTPTAGEAYGLGEDKSSTGMVTNLIILLGMPIFWGLAFLLVGIYYLRNNSALILPVLFILINVEAVVGLLEPYTTYIVIVTWLVIAMNFIFVQKKSTG